jgi:hypothetical protein
MGFFAQYELMIHGVYGKKNELLQHILSLLILLPNMCKVVNHNAYLKL